MQNITLELLKLGNNIFLTGSAGTGKTYLLTQYINYLKSKKIYPTILAPTGIAASLLKGKTIHSFYGLNFQEDFSDEYIDNLVQKKHLQKRFENLQVLIIDEISMVSPNIFTAIDKITQKFKKNNLPFGGIQVILSGDFFQLPPIVKDNQNYKFAWQSQSWKDANFKTCYLTKKYRQDDYRLIEVLDAIRNNNITKDIKNILDERIDKTLNIDYSPTKLYTHNKDVDYINIKELNKLPNKEYIYVAEKSGNKTNINKIFSSSLVIDTLTLKKDTLVMFIKNDNENQYVNGTTGVIIGFDKSTNNPIVKLSNSKKITVDKVKFTLEDLFGNTVATVKQYPLKLAWAITIHKSQGMTLDAAEIDLSNTFETGQGYVALSRIKNIEGLRLIGYNDTALQVDPLILRVDNHIKKASKKTEEEFNSLGKKVLLQQQKSFINKLKGKKPKEKKKPNHIVTKELIPEAKNLQHLHELRGFSKRNNNRQLKTTIKYR